MSANSAGLGTNQKIYRFEGRVPTALAIVSYICHRPHENLVTSENGPSPAFKAELKSESLIGKILRKYEWEISSAVQCSKGARLRVTFPENKARKPEVETEYVARVGMNHKPLWLRKSTRSSVRICRNRYCAVKKLRKAL